MGKRGLLLRVMTVVLLATSPMWAKPMPKPAPPNVGANAGRISALLPVAKIMRGTGKNAVTSEAKKGDELVWNDLVKTEKGGRARITLADQSILSLGSQAELRIVKHDAKSQQTTLQMAYGRVRAQVASITRDGGSFELRTPTAVAGVIGTDFGVDSSSVGGDTFVCLAGAVQISNSDKSVAGSVQCNAGQTTTVQPGKAPTPPKPASLQQLQQLIQDTEPAMIASISPAAALPGTNFDSTIAGSKMGKVNNVSVAGGAGVTASIKSATETGVTIHVVVSQGAAAGPRTITLAKESGASSATVFTVLGIPIGDPKKAYLDTLEQLRQTGISGLGGFLTGAQQAADQVAQQITTANQNLPKPLDLSPFADSLNQQYGVVSVDLKSADTTISKAAEEAANTFAQLYDTAYQALLQRDPTGTPDTTFRNGLTAAFQQANAILQTAINNSQQGLNTTVQTYGNSLNQIQQTWSQNINVAFIDQQAGPLPKINALERIVELGAVAQFDAGNSAASNASISINSFKWTLCSQSYQPSGFGQVLDQAAESCTAIAGYQSASSEFEIPTCSLQPGAYFARLAVSDSNNKTSQMDVKLTVLQPNYGSPATAVRGLADSYSSLQLSQFLRWFDSTQFNGYTVVSENIRKTLQDLSSMNINLRVSQENVNCNDATVRADWQQNYSFTANPSTVLKQNEQLSVRLQRTPGIGWLVTDFQGDNGTVQGVPPAINNVDVAAPDLAVTAANYGSGMVDPNGNGQIAPGLHTFQATITNAGKADLTSSLSVVFSLQDAGGKDLIMPVTKSLNAVAAGSSVVVTADLNVPDVNAARLVVTVNPANQAPEQAFGNNTSSFGIDVVHQPDLAIGTFTLPSALQMGQTFSLNVPVSNTGLSAVAGWDIVVTLGGQTVFSGTGPSVPTNGQVLIPVQFTVPQLATAPADLKGTQVPAFVVTINSNHAVPETNTTNNVSSNAIETADFTLITVATGTLNGILGRQFNVTALSVAPSPYPLNLGFTYTGLPAGIISSNTVISGVPTTSGNATVTASAAINGVTHNATAPISLVIGDEINVVPTGTPAFFTGGPSQNLTLNVTGGVYPVTVALTLPTGFTTTSGTVNGNIATQVLTGPGSITYSLSASPASTQGSQNFAILATDPGVPATQTPAGSRSFQAAYIVTGLPDLQIGTVTLPPAIQMGATVNATIPVVNNGVAAAAAGWDLVVSINGQTAGTAIGPTIPAGQTVNVPVVLTIPQVGAPPVTTSVPAAVIVNSNQAIQEISATNNSFSSNVTLVDFVLNTLPTGISQGVVGRVFTLPAVTIQPTPYPITVNVTYSGLPSGLGPNAGTLPNGLTGATIIGNPTSALSGAVSIFGSTGSVSHGSNASFQLQINNEIALTQSGSTLLDAGGPAQDLTVNVTGGIYPVTLSLTLPSGVTTTSGTVNGNISTLTLTGPGLATWALQANFTAATGSNLPITVLATDGGFPTTGTPAGNIVLTGRYSVNANAKYVITSIVIPGHTPPYVGANGLQEGETFQFLVTVANQGNGSPTGSISLSADCGVPAVCQPPLTAGPVAAPAAGSSTTVTINGNIQGLPVASYPNGTITLTTDVSGAVVGTPAALAFDVVDFTFAPNLVGPPQNLPIGSSGQLSVQATAQVPSGSPFPVSIVPVTDPNLSFIPASQNAIGANITFQVNVGNSAVPGTGNITFNATNHGVTKSAIVPVNYFTANMTSTTLFANDQANPLSVPMAVGAQAPQSFPTIGLKMNGNFVGGQANLSVQQPGCGNFTVNLFPTSAQPGDQIDLPIFANAGNTCPAGTKVILNAQIPQTQPPTTVPVYTLFVTSKGLPQLQVISATPPRDLSQQPWLSGEPLDWTVTVKNFGSGPSIGNEKVTIFLNNAEVGQGTVAGPIAAGQQTLVSIHTVASDVPEDFSLSPFGSVRVNVASDTQGDLAPGTQDFFVPTSVTLANWGIQVNGAGDSDANPLGLLVGGTTSGTATIAFKTAANNNPTFAATLVTGAYSSAQLSPPGIAPSLMNSGGTSTVTVSFPATNSPVDGVYFVQVIAQLKDGGVVTAQRQATIHVRISNQFVSGGQVVLASDRNNIAGCPDGCGTPPSVVQINGPLPEALTLTGSLSFCSGSSCPGTADVSFTDTFMTTTTPPSSTIQVTSPGNTLPVRVKAADNPDGSINTGAATVNVSVTAVQATSFPTFAARTPTPDPVGNNQFIMNFNIGDLDVSTGASCLGIAPLSPNPTSVSPSFFVVNGFNVPSVAWEWQDTNHIPVGGNPLQFDVSSGTSTFTGNGYTPLPTFTLNNVSAGVDGVQTYYLAITVANGIATATKYFPFQFDLSQSQTFCPINLGAARGSGGGTIIRGSWGKAGLMGAALAPAKARAAVSGRMPDLRILASDVSFTPSMPKQGDTVSVRFRISNMGEVDAKDVPVALQVNGATVVSDTFDVGAGKTTLAGLEWTNAHAVAMAAVQAPSRAPVMTRSSRGSRVDPVSAVVTSTIPTANAALVIDPQHTIMQKTTIAKSAALAHFSLRSTTAEATTIATFGEQRVVLQLSEGGCAGLKFALGAGSCINGDVTVTVEDLAKGTYKFEAAEGIADLGIANRDYSHAIFSSQMLGQSGHTYAVQLKGGQVGLLTMQAVRNPDQLSEAAKRVFHQQAARAIRKIAASTDAPETGDTAGKASESMVYFDIVYQGQ